MWSPARDSPTFPLGFYTGGWLVPKMSRKTKKLVILSEIAAWLRQVGLL